MGDDVLDHRRRLETAGLDLGDVVADPFEQFATWYSFAREAGVFQPDAMALATVDGDGRPSVRHVLLKGLDGDGFTFFTNYESAKGRDLAADARASVVFPWLQLNRQVRVSGDVERVSAAESDEYFATRPRGSQLGVWASAQSDTIATRADLEAAASDAEAKYNGRSVDRPPHWGGYRLVPILFEFWQGRADRLHDRLLYSLAEDGTWPITRLQP